MKTHSTLAALLALGIFVTSPRSVAAQSAPADVRTWTSWEPSEVMAAHAAPAGPPSNLIGPAEVHRLAEELWRGSRTFRRQAARIAAAPELQITISVGVPRRDGAPRALSTCHREAGTLVRADVWIPAGMDAYELLAHELEHIIEQLDGVDLPALEKQAGSGVRTGSRGTQYETIRAIAVGRQVAKEMWQRPVVIAAR